MIDLAKIDANQIIPGLWQGSAPDPGTYPVSIIVLAAQSYQPPDSAFPGVRVLRVPLRDVESPIPAAHATLAVAVAAQVAEAVRRKQPVLVTCMRGWNRSGLVSTLALRFLGYSADDAIRLVRAARSNNAISNPVFEAFARGFQPPAPPARNWTGPVVAGAIVLTTAIGLWAWARSPQRSRVRWRA